MPKLVRQEWWPENPYEQTKPIVVLEKVELFNQGCKAMVDTLRLRGCPTDELAARVDEGAGSGSGCWVFIPDDKE